MDFMPPSARACAGAREGLRAAQARARQAEAEATAAADVAARALTGVERQVSAIASLDGVSARIVEWGARQLKAGMVGAPLPADLERDRQALRAAGERQADAEGVLALLKDEARQAADEAQAARSALAQALDAVLQEDAALLVDRLQDAEREAGRLRAMVTTLLASRPVASAPLPWSIVEIVHHPHHVQLLAMAPKDAMPAASAAWSAYRTALVTDASAEPPE